MTGTIDRPSLSAADHRDAPLTLDEPAPRTLTLADQTGMWANLGVSILGFSGAFYVLDPLQTNSITLSLGAGIAALLIGTVLGSAAVAIAGLPGTVTGAPAMVLLRGLFGARLSWLPTALNIVQLLGWTTFELVTISTAMQQVAGGQRWVYVVIGGVLTTAFSLRPLGWIRVLRRYVTVAVAIALVYFAVQLFRHPLPPLGHGNWTGFWTAVDTVIGVAVSWVPVAADYTRHSRSVRDTVVGVFVGYSVTQIACYGIGMLTLFTVAAGKQDHVFSAFLAIPLGTVAFGVLAIREVDQSFVDAFSTAVSIQNVRPRWDRRPLALIIGLVTTVATLVLDVNDYENFLILIGGVFVPLLGVFAVDWFLVSGRSWDLSEQARSRWLMLVPWLAGFITYQLINPGYIGWWAQMWGHVRWFEVPSWASASLFSFAVAALATIPLGLIERTLSAHRWRGR